MKTLRVIFMLLCIFMISSQLCLARSSNSNGDKDKNKHHCNKKTKKNKAKRHQKKSKKQKSKNDNVEIQFQRQAGTARPSNRSQQAAHPAAIVGAASIHKQNEQEQENKEALEALILANQNNNYTNNTY